LELQQKFRNYLALRRHLQKQVQHKDLQMFLDRLDAATTTTLDLFLVLGIWDYDQRRGIKSARDSSLVYSHLKPLFGSFHLFILSLLNDVTDGDEEIAGFPVNK
jgi:hypothetical protein